MIGFLFLAFVILVFWLTTELGDALYRDRLWKWWATFILEFAIILPIGKLLDYGPAGWSFGREAAAVFICLVLLRIGSGIHQRQNEKPLIRLPKKAEPTND